jgi:hypothetical protein
MRDFLLRVSQSSRLFADVKNEAAFLPTSSNSLAHGVEQVQTTDFDVALLRCLENDGLE